MVCRRAAWSSRPRSQRFPQDHRPSEAWEESRPSSFTADGEGRVNHAGSPSEWLREELKNRYRDHPASCEFKSVFSQPVIHCVPRAPAMPPAPPGARCSFVTGHTKWRDIHIGDPSNLSKWSLPSNFLHGSFNGPTQEYQRTVHSHAEHPLYSRLRFSRGTRKAAR